MISTINFEHGEKTCASEPGKFCRWEGSYSFGTRHVCMLFDNHPLFFEDGWLQRCWKCTEEFGPKEQK